MARAATNTCFRAPTPQIGCLINSEWRKQHATNALRRLTEPATANEREAPHGELDVVVYVEDAQEATDRDGAANPTR